MGIGFRELIVLMVLLVVPLAVLCGVIVGAVWFVQRRNRASSLPRVQRSVADRLAELESLQRAGHISTGEYEKQRASIISDL